LNNRAEYRGGRRRRPPLLYSRPAWGMSEPFPVHNAAIYFMDSKAYTVNTGDRFQLEQVVPEPGYQHTEWLVGEGYRGAA